jgi:hypothetical protein
MEGYQLVLGFKKYLHTVELEHFRNETRAMHLYQKIILIRMTQVKIGLQSTQTVLVYFRVMPIIFEVQ